MKEKQNHHFKMVSYSSVWLDLKSTIDQGTPLGMWVKMFPGRINWGRRPLRADGITHMLDPVWIKRDQEEVALPFLCFLAATGDLKVGTQRTIPLSCSVTGARRVINTAHTLEALPRLLGLSQPVIMEACVCLKNGKNKNIHWVVCVLRVNCIVYSLCSFIYICQFQH